MGSILYIMHATRPDLAFTIIRLSQFASCTRTIHWEGIKRVLRYLKGTRLLTLALGNIGNNDSPLQTSLVGYFDLAHADTGSRRSTCGYLFLLNGSPVSWCSRVQRTIALSTTEAEYVAGTEAAREAIWLKGLLDTICSSQPVKWPISLCCDN